MRTRQATAEAPAKYVDSCGGPLENLSMGISPFSVGKPSINGPSIPFYTIAMLVYQRVTSMGISQFLFLSSIWYLVASINAS